MGSSPSQRVLFAIVMACLTVKYRGKEVRFQVGLKSRDSDIGYTKTKSKTTRILYVLRCKSSSRCSPLSCCITVGQVHDSPIGQSRLGDKPHATSKYRRTAWPLRSRKRCIILDRGWNFKICCTVTLLQAHGTQVSQELRDEVVTKFARPSFPFSQLHLDRTHTIGKTAQGASYHVVPASRSHSGP